MLDLGWVWLCLGLLVLGLEELLLVLSSLREVDVYLLLELLELDVVLGDVDVAVSQKSANFANIIWSDGVVAVRSGQGFGETDQRLKGSDCHLVAASVCFKLLSLSDGLVFFLENLSTFLRELWIDSPAEFDVGLELLLREISRDCITQKSVHFDNMLSNHVIFIIVLLIKYDKEDIKS